MSALLSKACPAAVELSARKTENEREREKENTLGKGKREISGEKEMKRKEYWKE